MLSHREVPTHLTLPTALDELRIRNVLDAQRALEQRRAQRPALRARLTARLLGARLDRALIAGADPASAPPLAARAARLASRDVRFELAAGLELVLASAQRHRAACASAPGMPRSLPTRHCCVSSPQRCAGAPRCTCAGSQCCDGC